MSIMVMVMEVVRMDEQGRLVIPKGIRERKGLTGELEMRETEDGVVLRPRRQRSWDVVLSPKLRVDWSRALSVSLEKRSTDDLLFT